MNCRFCMVRHAQEDSDICAYCDLSWSAEMKEALYALTEHNLTGIAQETNHEGSN